VSTTVWDVRAVKPLDPDMIAEAATHPLVITIEDGLRAGGGGEAIRDLVLTIDHRVDVRVLGVPTEYVPHGKPDTILAGFGLDSAGVVRIVDAARNADT
jgi:1-deoxy-D-xylulose-5-phosphate synthase